MKIVAVLSLLIVLCFCWYQPLYGQEPVASIAVLPVHSAGIDSVYVQTAESILRTEIGKLSTMDIISQRRTLEALGGSSCWETDCAIAVGKSLNASYVAGCQLSPLGDKVVVAYFLVSVANNRAVLIDQTTAPTIEDLEMVMKRIAQSIVEHQPTSKNAEVGNIMASETTMPLRRTSWRHFGLSFGYLYPKNGTYDNADRSFVADARFDYEMNDYAVGMLLGVRDGFATNLYGLYFLSRKDVCPYVGGAWGFHWVSHDNPNAVLAGRTYKTDGFELTTSAGMRILHTYNFELVFNLEYIYSFNDYNDRAIVFTLGIM